MTTTQTPTPTSRTCSTCAMPDHGGDAYAHLDAYGHFPTYRAPRYARPSYLTTPAEVTEWDALLAAYEADVDSHRLYIAIQTLLTDPTGTAGIPAEYPALIAAGQRYGR